MKTIAFFNNKGGVGKTTLVYHLAWMYAEIGFSVVAADLDPQANLSAVFLSEDRLEQLWPDGDHPDSVLGAVSPILRGLGDIREPHVEQVAANLGLVVGDLGLSSFEAKLSAAWPGCLGRDEAAFRTESAFHRTILDAAAKQNADLALIDVGPNLGAINRAAIIAANFVVFPLAPDLFSLQALRNVGPTLREWRSDWQDRVERRPQVQDLDLPSADIVPAGYVVMQHAVREGRPVQAYQKWMGRIPEVYRKEVLARVGGGVSSTEDDSECLIDVGPNLGAINRAAIIAANFVVFPLAPDLFSLQALRNVGPTLREWRSDWQDRVERRPQVQDLDLPSADIVPAGYVVMQHAVREGRPVQAYQKWVRRIPEVYRKEVLARVGGGVCSTEDDSECLATLKHYRSLMAMAHEARKPMFHLRAADGALGGHIYAVQDCRKDFERLARSIASKCGVCTS